MTIEELKIKEIVNMAKMGSRKHLKRYKAPKSWPIHPKEDTWTVKPSAGSHSIEDSIPLTLVIRANADRKSVV